MVDFSGSSNREAVQIGSVSGTNTNNFWLNKHDNAELSYKALYYGTMNQRMRQILEASAKTLEWIWSTSFADWLGSKDDRLFWISGKPGSGKSTLTKHLAFAQKTIDHLPRENERWIRIHFFFDFRAGGDTRNTIEGMWRSLALQIAEKLPDASRCFGDIATQSAIARFQSEDLKERIFKAFEMTNLRF
ncbi:MAG: hypothetical protein Q9160_001449 [Pyrenula sp. 1 TL-2023]